MVILLRGEELEASIGFSISWIDALQTLNGLCYFLLLIRFSWIKEFQTHTILINLFNSSGKFKGNFRFDKSLLNLPNVKDTFLTAWFSQNRSLACEDYMLCELLLFNFMGF